MRASTHDILLDAYMGETSYLPVSLCSMRTTGYVQLVLVRPTWGW